MKKIISVLLALLLCASVCGCNNTDTPSRASPPKFGETTNSGRQKREDGDIRLVIPFLGRDEAVVTKSELSSDYLESETPSLSIRPEQAQAPEDADYYWQSFDGLISRRVLSVNTAVLASLHKQAPVLPDEVNSEQNYLFRLDRDSRELKQQFRSKGWMDLESIDIKDWQSSTVSFPAFAPQK